MALFVEAATIKEMVMCWIISAVKIGI